MERVLITGAAGCLGQHLLHSVPEGVEVHATWRNTPTTWPLAHQIELSDRDRVAQLVADVQPDLVIHTAYSSFELDRDVGKATANLVDAAADAGARFIYMSTDLVLDGDNAPYDEAATPEPIMDYGRAKASAEAYVCEHISDAAIIRSSLILGLDPINPSSQWIIDAMGEKRPITLFVDELRTPIGASDLAMMLWDLAGLERATASGIWNFVGPEALSRYTIGLLLARAFDLDPSCIRPGHSNESSARRPRDLRMTDARARQFLRTRPRTATDVLLNG